jgi:hypothetical protein
MITEGEEDGKHQSNIAKPVWLVLVYARHHDY